MGRIAIKNDFYVIKTAGVKISGKWIKFYTSYFHMSSVFVIGFL